MRTKMEEERKEGRRLWEEDMLIGFSFFLHLSESARLWMGRESRRIEAVGPRKAPHPPPPWRIVCCLFASLFLHKQTLCSRQPGHPAPLPMTPPKANHKSLFFFEQHFSAYKTSLSKFSACTYTAERHNADRYRTQREAEIVQDKVF